MNLRLIVSLVSFLIFLISAAAVSAHVVVRPEEVVIGDRTDFTVGVPNEKDIPTTSVRLIIPESLKSVTPYVKPGWEIELKKTGSGEDKRITEIMWKGGSIGTDLRDSFTFRALTPTEPTNLIWKAYQTYSDGTMVSWDQDSENSGQEEEINSGPASKTQVKNDLNEEPRIAESFNNLVEPLAAYAALLLSGIALILILRRKV